MYMRSSLIVLCVLAAAACTNAQSSDDKPPRGSWNITSPENRTCILSFAGIRLSFNYLDSTNKSQDVTVDVPTNATSDGSSCGDADTADETLQLNFDDFVIKMVFKYKEKKYSMSDVSVAFKFDAPMFPGGSGNDVTLSLVNQTLFITPNESSYQCVSNSSFKDFQSTAVAPTLEVFTTDLRIQAFRKQFLGEFDTAVPCPADTEVSNIVPIAVGAALAALVIIVLIAYLIGRKKSKRGYESV